jgi:translation elongation factor EF-1alpha
MNTEIDAKLKTHLSLAIIGHVNSGKSTLTVAKIHNIHNF